MARRAEDLTSFITKSIQSSLKDVHTCLPGIIESFNPENQTVEVQPSIARVLVNGQILPLPKLINVPIIIPRVGSFSVTLPINKGDECLILFSGRSTDNWFKSGGVDRPNDIRMHDLSDGFALVGIGNETKSISNYDTENLQIRNEDASVSVTVKPSDELELKAPTKVLIDTPLLECTGDIQDSIGTMDRLRQNYNTATYIGNLGSPTSTTSLPDV